MDPNETLRLIREAVGGVRYWTNRYQDGTYSPGEDVDSDDLALSAAAELADRVHDLDEWIGRGGFLPLGWQR